MNVKITAILPPPRQPDFKLEMELTREEACSMRAKLNSMNIIGPTYALFCALCDALEGKVT